MDAVLALADGELFFGRSIGASGEATGEVVFNTAMTGYQEILTDPSYASQIVAMTCAHIGNTGVNSEDVESDRLHLAGLLVRDAPNRHSSYRATGSLRGYLGEHGCVAAADIDTRRLTRRLRDGGSQPGCLLATPGAEPDVERALSAARECPSLIGQNLVERVTTPAPYCWIEGRWQAPWEPPLAPLEPSRHVVVYDYGVKRNILRELVSLGCRVTVVPALWSAERTFAMRPDGIVLSNGPGDPEACNDAINIVEDLTEQRDVPVMGICFGYQLLALAWEDLSQRRSMPMEVEALYKMKFGHHGANHPVRVDDDFSVLVTSQNHGFAADFRAFPPQMVVTHRSLFDGSLQGLRFLDRPVFGFQGHPEASPGPRDALFLFERFVELMDAPLDERALWMNNKW